MALSLIAVGITLVWFTTVANLVATLRRVLRRPRVPAAGSAVTASELRWF